MFCAMIIMMILVIRYNDGNGYTVMCDHNESTNAIIRITIGMIY